VEKNTQHLAVITIEHKHKNHENTIFMVDLQMFSHRVREFSNGAARRTGRMFLI